MSTEYIRKEDVEVLIKAYFKTKIEDGETALDPVDTGVELLRILDGLPVHESADEKTVMSRALAKIIQKNCANLIGLSWISCELEEPEEEGQVLVLVCGKYKNITFDHAVLLGEYVDGEWILDRYPEATDITVSHWAFIPDLPAEVKK